MRFKPFLIGIISIAIITSLSGCKPKVWVYDFALESSLIRGDEEWHPNSDNYSFSSGLILDDAGVVAPHYYNGDFSVTLDFKLDTSPSDTAYIEFLLLSYAGGMEWEGGILIPDAGSATSTLYLFMYTPSTGSQYPGSVPIAALLYEIGDNTIKIDKVGDLLKFSVNGTLIASCLLIVGYERDSLYPYFGCFYVEADECVFKTVTIEYKGDQVLID